MAINLLDMLKEQMTDTVIGQAANILGENSSATSSAVGAILPTILGSVIGKGSTQSGAGRLLNMIADGKHDGGVFDNLGSLLGGGDATTGFMKSGGSLLSGLLGNNLGSVIDLVTSVTGMRRNSSSSLMNMLAPMVMGMIGRYVRKNGLNAGGLMDMLLGQKKHVSSALPKGMGSLLGFGETTGSTTSASSYETANNDSGGGGGMWKWLLLGLAALAGMGYFGMRTGCAAVDNAADTVSTTTTNVVEGAGNMAASAAGTVKDAAGNVLEGTVNAAGDLVDASGKVIKKAGEFTVETAKAAGNAAMDAAGTVKDAAGNVLEGTVNAAGDLVDGTGKVIKKAGEFTVETAKAVGEAASSAMSYTKDKAGNLVDASGKIIHKAGEFTVDKSGNFLDKAGKTIGGAASATTNAISGGGEATAEELKVATAKFKTSFTEMFKKADVARKAGDSKAGKVASKAAGATGVSGTITYTLTDIVFKEGSQRIETYTKAEVEGLAAALKSYPKAKIKVMTSGDNKALAGQRANAVHDMLATLGVDKKQLSHKGTKGDAMKVEIVVE